jgi:hypothetical protein
MRPFGLQSSFSSSVAFPRSLCTADMTWRATSTSPTKCAEGVPGDRVPRRRDPQMYSCKFLTARSCRDTALCAGTLRGGRVGRVGRRLCTFCCCACVICCGMCTNITVYCTLVLLLFHYPLLPARSRKTCVGRSTSSHCAPRNAAGKSLAGKKERLTSKGASGAV